MSVVKLLQRVMEINPTESLRKQHEDTYGLASDPLVQFACVFAALVHDLNHPGVPNSQLVKEQDKMALAYKGESVAEQNLVDMAWHLFMHSHRTSQSVVKVSVLHILDDGGLYSHMSR